jgi:enamine deaminase RidA (YjgF/YER057c/UK114 family)
VAHRRIAGHSPFEEVMGYARAVVAGDHVYVAGTAPIPTDGSDPPEGAYEQTRLCLDIVGGALERAGSGLEDVVRTCVYLTDASAFDDMARAHGEVFRDIRPVNTTVVIAGLVDPRWLLELDVVAVLQTGAP